MATKKVKKDTVIPIKALCFLGVATNLLTKYDIYRDNIITYPKKMSN